MPKFSLKRRHNRQHDLSALRECPVDNYNRTTAARIVSDDDIQVSTELAQAEEKNTASSGSLRSFPGLKRRAPSGNLCDFAPSTPSEKPFVESQFLCVSPSRGDRNLDTPRASPSPWGHFVDMVIPSSSSEENMTSGSQGKTRHRFLPFCPEPEPDVVSKRRHHPYHSSGRRRKGHHRHHLSGADKKLDGFVATAGESAALEEAQDALMGLHV